MIFLFFLFPQMKNRRKGQTMSTQKEPVFRGAATALVTPFNENGIDYPALAAMIEWQIGAGIDALVFAGTTGERSTLSGEEHRALLRFAVRQVAGRVPVIAGTGGNDTAFSLALSRDACEIGCDALLLVTPYYNKCTPSGMLRHFFTIADAITKPVLLYNVPSRTGVDIPLPVYRELARHERIAGVKEASGNLSAVAGLLSECGDQLPVYTGNDDQTVPVMALGGLGAISVFSGILPGEMHALCAACLAGDFKKAAALQLKYLPLMHALFSEVNPIPVKTALGLMGRCRPDLRLPLCKMEKENKEKLAKLLGEFHLLP